MDKLFNVLYDSHQIFNKFWNDSSYLVILSELNNQFVIVSYK
jgi:hypothetical protein